jgi:hypothetical protein
MTPATDPTNIPALTVDITTDTCRCGASYQTRDGDPDPVVYRSWLDVHDEHFDGVVD